MGGDSGFYRKAVSKADVWAARATAVAKGNQEPYAGNRVRVGLVSQCRVAVGDMGTVDHDLSQVVMITLVQQEVCTIQPRWRLQSLPCCLSCTARENFCTARARKTFTFR